MRRGPSQDQVELPARPCVNPVGAMTGSMTSDLANAIIGAGLQVAGALGSPWVRYFCKGGPVARADEVH